jgi:hypothetical protein
MLQDALFADSVADIVQLDQWNGGHARGVSICCLV